MAIYEQVKHFAKIRNISIRSLERHAGLSNGTIQKWNVSEPGTFSLRRVAALLDVTVDDLLRVSDENSTEETA